MGDRSKQGSVAGVGGGLSDHEVIVKTVTLPSGQLRLRQPAESAELPDDGAVEWAPLVPYASVLWRSGVALARELDSLPLRGKRVVELGCGLAAPSLAAARAGAAVMATDADGEALPLVAENAALNGVRLATARVSWARPRALLAMGRFDLALAADVLYERAAVERLLELLPRIADEVWLADPGRPAESEFLERAARGWRIDTRVRGIVRIHRMVRRRAV